MTSATLEHTEATPAQLPFALPLPRHVRVVDPPRASVLRAVAVSWQYRAAWPYFARLYARRGYGGMFLGITWLFLRPAIPLALQTLIYGGVFKVTTGSTPYYIWITVTSASWQLFSHTAYYSTRSLEFAKKILRRMYVPRLLVISAVPTKGFQMLGIHLVFTVGGLIYYVFARGHFYLHLRLASLLALPGFIVIALLGLTVGLWTASISPKARDIRFTVSYFLGFWYFLTPVIYPVSRIPAGWRFLASLNPVTAPIELVKYAVFNQGTLTPTAFAVTGGYLLVVGGGGLLFFLRREQQALEDF